MQKRHLDRERYFLEQSVTSEKYYMPFITKHLAITSSSRVLEVGCGEGGNLLPFTKLGCEVCGIDQSEVQIRRAKKNLNSDQKNSICLINADFLQLSPPETEQRLFDVILLHDVIEHIEIPQKAEFLQKISCWLKADGVLFVGFPPWQMPFGGHQQICQSKIVSTIPFMHLMPTSLYRSYLKICGESDGCVSELLSIKRSRTTIEFFEGLVLSNAYSVVDKVFWFINPHYEVKFGLSPRRIYSFLGRIPRIRNYFITSCFYLLKL